MGTDHVKDKMQFFLFFGEENIPRRFYFYRPVNSKIACKCDCSQRDETGANTVFIVADQVL
jgi:hypothetical protein